MSSEGTKGFGGNAGVGQSFIFVHLCMQGVYARGLCTPEILSFLILTSSVFPGLLLREVL